MKLYLYYKKAFQETFARLSPSDDVEKAFADVVQEFEQLISLEDGTSRRIHRQL